MASKNDDHYDDDDFDEEGEAEEEDDDDDEEEGDFEPGADIDDDLDDDFVEDDVDDDGADENPFLQGLLYSDEGNAIVFEDSNDGHQQYFRFVSEEKQPTSWSIHTPLLEKPIMFSGTITGLSLKFEIGITKYDTSEQIDHLDERFLKIQEDMQPLYVNDPASTALARAKSGDDSDIEDAKPSALDCKKPFRARADGNNKEENSTSFLGKDIYVFQAEQLSPDINGISRNIRGVFRVAPTAARIFVPVIVITHASTADNVASHSAKVVPAAAAVARKRSRTDDEDDGDDAVGYQELIDLHDDAGLSTEELRRRYYGGGENGMSNPENKKAKQDHVEEDDDDDAYGF